MAVILDARVKQKVATAEEWAGDNTILLEGEQGFLIQDSGEPINFKIGDGTKTFAELPYWIDYSQAAYIPYSESPNQDIAYTIVGAGTYGSITVPSGEMAVLGWNGTSWFLNSAIDVSGPDVVDNLETEDPDKALSSNQGVVLDDKIDSIKEGGLNDDVIGLDKLTQAARDFIGSGGEVVNNPDDEDLTSDVQGGVNVIKLKDRPFTPADFSGLGNTILRKNISGGINILSESDFIENTIFEIRYDFDLNNTEVNIPENVVIVFVGGSIKNGTLIGNNTKISASNYKIFEDIVFEGSFDIDLVPVEWFGAQSVVNQNEDWSTANSQYVTIHPDILALPDASISFNNALLLSQKSGGKAIAGCGAYKISDTVNVIQNTTLIIPSNSAVVPVMTGSGLLDPGDSDPVLRLNSNEYIPTDSMAIAINISPQSGRIEGMGYISAAACEYTIILYMLGKGYMAGDMQFAPHVNIRTVGGNWGQTGADTDTILGTTDPDSGTGVQGDTYLNTITKRMFIRGASSWSFLGNANARFNTSVRFEVNANDMRIINMNFDLWDMYGYRGIEFVQSNGGWCNQSYFKGTVSNKISSYLSFYNDEAPATQGEWARHDLTQMSFQVDRHMTKEARIVYGERLRFSTFGQAWDLWWFRSDLRSLLKYELREQSEGNIVPIDQNFAPFVLDLGTNNITIPNLDKKNPDNIGFSLYTNYFKYRTPYSTSPRISGIRRFQTFDEITDIETIFSTLRANTNRPPLSLDDAPKQLFDEDNASYYDVIDTGNGLYAGALSVIDGDAGFPGREYGVAFLEVSYLINPQVARNIRTGVGQNIRYAIYEEDADGITISPEMQNRIFPNSSMPSTQEEYATEKMYIPITFAWDRRRWFIAFFVDDEQVETRVLRIYNIKLWYDNQFVSVLDENKGTTAQRPDSAPKGHLYFNTSTGGLQVNTGDSVTQTWATIELGV